MSLKNQKPGAPASASGASEKANQLPQKGNTSQRSRNATKQAAWADRNPLAVWAHKAYASALRRGLIERLPCEVCGEPKTDFHHDAGYDRPLAGRFLCHRHHQQVHAAERKASNGEG